MRKRIILLIVVLIMTLSLTGCFGKVWRVSFAFPAYYDDWDVQTWGDGSLTPVPFLGVRLDNQALGSPVAFDEDFTVTVTFTLNTEIDKTVSFGILIGDSDEFYPDNHVYSFFSNIGNEGAEDWQVTQDHVYAITPVVDGTLPTLLRKGPNFWKLIKTGNNIQIFVNLYEVADFELTTCNADYYHINLFSHLEGGGDFIFNNIRVDYSGSII